MAFGMSFVLLSCFAANFASGHALERSTMLDASVDL